MLITLHCGGMPFDGGSFATKSLGGSETAAYYVAVDLAKQGHRVVLFTNSKNEGIWQGVRFQWAGEMTEQTPLGDRFTFYAENTPCDILMIQRHPDAWRHNWAAKFRIWWLHDLALERNKRRVHMGLWGVDAICVVSDYHLEQVASVYGIEKRHIHVLRNGIDMSLYSERERLHKTKPKDGKMRLIYSSRPERGLEHLVMPGGIMEQLGEEFELCVCMYENVPDHIRDYYEYLWGCIENLPNCKNLGSLNKEDLAQAMMLCDAMVYPTEFEEVSCITAMEAAASGLPFISSKHAALPETTRGGGAKLFDLKFNQKKGRADREAFVDFLRKVKDKPRILEAMRDKQVAKAESYSWEGRGQDIIKIFNVVTGKIRNDINVARHLMRNSDIYALKHHMQTINYIDDDCSELIEATKYELDSCYEFADETEGREWKSHYDNYYEHEAEKGADFGPQDVTHEQRFQQVAEVVRKLPEGSRVLDYGCAHGHYTMNLAALFPGIQFVGIDIAASNIEKAKEWALENTEFVCGYLDAEGGQFVTPDGLGNFPGDFDAIVCAEVLEHVAEPAALTDALCAYLKGDGTFIGTTPYGPWEADTFRQDWPVRAHVHHFERADLHEMFGEHPDFGVKVIPFTPGADGRGSYFFTFGKPEAFSGRINYDRKLDELVPRQTVAACFILKDATPSMLQALNSVADLVDQVVIVVDKGTTDETLQTAIMWSSEHYPYPVVTIKCSQHKALDVGFDEMRNESLKWAETDWILWLDADEVISYPERIRKYLRHNQFSGYAVKQHHFSAEPLGVMKTDIPVRLFRNNAGIRFFGRVHEHPETAINEGVGQVMMIPDADILHSGYTNEATRRKRFWRNIPLMVKDREDYPERTLGKFLWLRDLCQMCQYELEQNGGRRTQGLQDRIEQGIDIFVELVDSGEVRYALEGLAFYSPLVRLHGGGFNASIKVAASQSQDIDPDSLPTYSGTFMNREHFEKLSRLVHDHALKDIDKPYQ